MNLRTKIIILLISLFLLIVIGIIISITQLKNILNKSPDNKSSIEQNTDTIQTQKYVEDYISKYSKDFTFINCENSSPYLNGQKDSDDTDWYFHDNELDFDFHVKTLKSGYPPYETHIACNYYVDYMKKFFDKNESKLEKIINDSFSEIYDIGGINIEFFHEPDQIRVSFTGKKSNSYSREKENDLTEKASKKICNILKEFDKNFENRCMVTGWDVDLNTDWSDTDYDLAIMVNSKIFKIKDLL